MIRGERVAERLEAAGLSQAELARRVGVSQPSVYKLINENKVGSRYLAKIARELGTTAAYLEGETDDPEAEVPDEVYSSDERDLISHWRMLDNRDRSTVRQLVYSLARRASETVHSPKPEYRAG